MLAQADGDVVLLLTGDGRAFRLPVAALPESPVRARGQELRDLLPLGPNGRVIGLLPDGGGPICRPAEPTGWVRACLAPIWGKSHSRNQLS